MSVIIVLKFCFSAFLSIRSLELFSLSHIIEIMMVSQHPGKYRILPSIFPDAGILVKVKKKNPKKGGSHCGILIILQSEWERGGTYFMEGTFPT